MYTHQHADGRSAPTINASCAETRHLNAPDARLQKGEQLGLHTIHTRSAVQRKLDACTAFGRPPAWASVGHGTPAQHGRS